MRKTHNIEKSTLYFQTSVHAVGPVPDLKMQEDMHDTMSSIIGSTKWSSFIHGDFLYVGSPKVIEFKCKQLYKNTGSLSIGGISAIKCPPGNYEYFRVYLANTQSARWRKAKLPVTKLEKVPEEAIVAHEAVGVIPSFITIDLSKLKMEPRKPYARRSKVLVEKKLASNTNSYKVAVQKEFHLPVVQEVAKKEDEVKGSSLVDSFNAIAILNSDPKIAKAFATIKRAEKNGDLQFIFNTASNTFSMAPKKQVV